MQKNIARYAESACTGMVKPPRENSDGSVYHADQQGFEKDQMSIFGTYTSTSCNGLPEPVL